MEYNNFWKIIKNTLIPKSDQKKYQDYEAQAQKIISVLATYPASEVMDFERIYQEFWGKAYTISMFEVFLIIHLDGSFDHFDWFRSWLIFQGEEIYTITLENPDNLADYIDQYDILDIIPESYVGIADAAFTLIKGGEKNIPDDVLYPSDIHFQLSHKFGDSGRIVGYTTDDLYYGHFEKYINAYPKIWKKFSQDWYNLQKDD